MTKNRQRELLSERNEIGYRSLASGIMSMKDTARLREIRIEMGLLPESVMIQTLNGILVIDTEEELIAYQKSNTLIKSSDIGS